MHEASQHDDNSYITLTYDDKHLPPGGTLVKSHFVSFMKRLRARLQYEDEKAGRDARLIRFYMCGEYGPRTLRPHYHALLFGYQYPDLRFHQEKRGHRLFTSKQLVEDWGLGSNCPVGQVTFQSAAYVARYIMKKQSGPVAYDLIDTQTGEITKRIPEYTNMSRMPGIGASWFSKFAPDVYPDDFIINEGKRVRVPRYYDRLFAEALGDDALLEIKDDRREAASLHKENQTPQRLKVRELVLESKITKLVRDDI